MGFHEPDPVLEPRERLPTARKKAPAPRERTRGSFVTLQTEAEGLEPPKACARRISSAVPYQLDYASSISRGDRI